MCWPRLARLVEPISQLQRDVTVTDDNNCSSCHTSPCLFSVAWRPGSLPWVGLLAPSSFSCLDSLETRLLHMNCSWMCHPPFTFNKCTVANLCLCRGTVISYGNASWATCRVWYVLEDFLPPTEESLLAHRGVLHWLCICYPKCQVCYLLSLFKEEHAFLLWGGALEALSWKSSPKGCGICW